MPLYRCDWPNGESTFVLAHHEQDAIEKLDEFDGATPAMLHEVRDFMLSIARVRLDHPEAEGEHDYMIGDIGERTLEHFKDLGLLEDRIDDALALTPD